MRFYSSYNRAVWDKPPYNIFTADTADFFISAVFAYSVIVAHDKKPVVLKQKTAGCSAAKVYGSGYLCAFDAVYQYVAVCNPNGITGQCDDTLYHCAAKRRAIKDNHVTALEICGAAVYYGKLHIVIGRIHGLTLDEIELIEVL